LGFAYQLGFLRLTGRFPAQQPLELLDDLLVFVAQEVALDLTLIQEYAQRRQTVSEHQHLLALYLGFQPFGSAEREALGHFLRDEALRVVDCNRNGSGLQSAQFPDHIRVHVPFW
jgi:hypothetical protein